MKTKINGIELELTVEEFKKLTEKKDSNVRQINIIGVDHQYVDISSMFGPVKERYIGTECEFEVYFNDGNTMESTMFVEQEILENMNIQEYLKGLFA
jgi:hypothetical protein